MKVLALDSSGLVASVAIMEDSILKAEYTIHHKKTHSQTLLPMLDEICRMTELDLKEIDGIAIAKGPGSFTGLRIGSATAKGLGLALAKPIVEVSTLEALAYNAYGVGGVVCPVMDARRSQVYTGIYRFEQNGNEYEIEEILPPCAISIEEICGKLNALGESVLFLGDAVPVYTTDFKDKMNVPFTFMAAQSAYQRAASVAALGIKKLKEGKGIPAAGHSPEYLRLSQAERERKEAGLL